MTPDVVFLSFSDVYRQRVTTRPAQALAHRLDRARNRPQRAPAARRMESGRVANPSSPTQPRV